jgi:hypothetical protein
MADSFLRVDLRHQKLLYDRHMVRIQLNATRVFAAVICLSCASSAAAQGSADGPQPVTADLIHFDINRDRVRLSDYVTVPGQFPPVADRAGPVILVFGAHWCRPCHDVVGQMHARVEELSPLGMNILYVHVDDVDRSEERSRAEIQSLIETMIEEPIFEGVRVLQGGDMAEVRQWLDNPEQSSLPGILFVTVGGLVFERLLDAGGFGEALDRFVESLAPPTP